MTQVVNLKLNGLVTNPNYLSEVPSGALAQCSNMNIDRDSVATKRRGFFVYGSAFSNSSARAKQLLTYKGVVLRHYDNIIEWDNASAFTPFAGSFYEVANNIRIKYQEVNGNLYFTTSDGIKKISASSASGLSSASVVSAGGTKALNLQVKTNYSKPGFFDPLSKVSYRIVWGVKDANNNTILGVPSPLTSATNYSETETAVVDLSFPIPDGITSDHFYQVYRTAIVTALDINGVNDLANQDECFLVIEDFPTALTGEVTLTDITPEDFRVGGTPCYTNAISGEGIAQSNEVPPLASDICLYRNYTFYANTKTKHRLSLSLTSVDSFISNSTKLVISNGTQTDEYTFVGQASQSTIVMSGADYTKIELDGKYFFVRSASDERLYGFWFDGTGTTAQPIGLDTVGVLMIRLDISAQSTNAGYLGVFKTEAENTLSFIVDVVGTTATITNIAAGNTNPWHISNSSLDPIPSPNALLGTTVFNDQVVQGLGEDFANKKILLSTKPTVGQRIEETALSIVSVINATSGSCVSAFYSSGPTDVPGQFYLESRSASDTAFYVGMTCTTYNISSIVTGSVTTTINTSTNHNLQLGHQVELYNITNGGGLNAKFNVASVPSATQFTINFDSSALTPSGGVVINGVPAQQFTPTLARVAEVSVQSLSNPTTLTTNIPHQLYSSPVIIYNASAGNPDIDGKYTPVVLNSTQFTIPVNTLVASTGSKIFAGSTVSSNEVSPNRLYFSKLQQPEAVPTLNYIDIGPKDRAILRVIALRDSLFVLKKDGIYRLSGDTTTNFSVSLFDSSSGIIAADSAVVLNNQIYLLSTQGIITISDAGVEIISRVIEDKIIKIFQNAVAASTSFAISSETDRAYYLSTTTLATDTLNTQILRYNTITKAWTTWDMSKTAGVVNVSGDNKIYFGASDIARIEKERKSLDRTDHADREYEIQLGVDAVYGNVIKPSSLTNVSVGDVVYQLQYVTLDQYNRTLKKLDIDPSLATSDFEATLLCTIGDHIDNKLAELAAKMNIADPSSFVDSHGNTSYVYTNPVALVDMQTQYNNMIDRMNESGNLAFTNYVKSTGTVNYEGLVTAVDTFTGKATLYAVRPFLEGSITVFKAIKSVVKWQPNTAGDPSTMKQMTSSTVLFEDLSFTTASIKYSTDLVKSYTGTEFSGQGTGIFGQAYYGEENFGGIASSEALRTLIPRDKARCRYISCEFDHGNAREEIKLFGMSITSYEISERAYQGRK